MRYRIVFYRVVDHWLAIVKEEEADGEGFTVTAKMFTIEPDPWAIELPYLLSSLGNRVTEASQE